MGTIRRFSRCFGAMTQYLYPCGMMVGEDKPESSARIGEMSRDSRELLTSRSRSLLMGIVIPAGYQRARAREFEECCSETPNEIRTGVFLRATSVEHFAATTLICVASVVALVKTRARNARCEFEECYR